MDKRANNRSRKPRGEASKARNMASRTPRGLFVISRSGVQVRPPAPALPWGTSEYGGVPEWPKGTDCKSAGYAYGGSNPPAPTKTALISSKSGLFCNFSGHFAFQRMEGRNGENQRQSKLARLRFSDSAPNPQVSENGFYPQLTHTGII